MERTPKLTLEIVLEAKDNAIGENGFIPSRLVFEILLRFPIISSELPTERERIEIIANAPMKMNAINAKRKISTKVLRNSLFFSKYNYSINDKRLTYS